MIEENWYKLAATLCLFVSAILAAGGRDGTYLLVLAVWWEVRAVGAESRRRAREGR